MASDKAASGGSLADRMTTSDGKKFESPKADPGLTVDSTETTSSKQSDGSSSWADELETPVNADPEPATSSSTQQIESDSIKAQLDGTTNEPPQKENGLEKAQYDGATDAQHGSSLDAEPSYNVNVRLIDAQADPNDPLYSIKSFEQLGL